jgi:DNA-binding XRE family transcriptional regulator
MTRHDNLTGANLPAIETTDGLDGTSEVGALIAAAQQDPSTSTAIGERRAGIDAYVTRRTARLADLRKAVGLTQQQVAAELGVSQPEVSKLEGRDTYLVETLARFVAATGGRLRIIAEYDNADTVVELTPLVDPAPETV